MGDTFFVIDPHSKTDTLGIATFLNSTLGSFLTEVYGRTVMGEGVLLIYGPEITPMPILDPGIITDEDTKVFKKLLPVKINSIFEELGASSPEEVSLDKVKPDRRELDKIIMVKILGHTEEEQLEVYRAVIDLVKSRIEKAKSVGEKRKTKEGIDIDMLVKTVMDKICGETLGKFYKENILSQKNFAVRTIPQPVEEVTTIKGIFGWSLKVGKKHIDCDSEEEAKYLKILAQSGLEKIKIPKDRKYLKKILPELETIKKKMDNIINDYLSSILDHKLREKLLHYIWQEIMK